MADILPSEVGDRHVFNLTNIGTVSAAASEGGRGGGGGRGREEVKLSRDGVERERAFPVATMSSLSGWKLEPENSQ